MEAPAVSRSKLTDEQRIDNYLDTAPKDQLIRLQANVAAALRWRFPVKPPATRTESEQTTLPGVKGDANA
jgi:hypothetical protein